MKRLAILYFITLFSSLFAYEEECSCGTVKEDPLYARAVFLLNKSIRNSSFFLGKHFPGVADEYLHSWGDYIDDSYYPFEGKITWVTTKHCFWKRESILKNDLENSSALYPPSHIEIPIRLLRILEWTELPNTAEEYEHCEKKVFNLEKNYGAIPQTFQALKNDIAMYCEKNLNFLNTRLQDLTNHISVYEPGGMKVIAVKKKTLVARKQKVQLACRQDLVFTEKKEAEAISACTQSLDRCIALHHNPLAHMNRGLFYYLDGDTIDALGQVKAALKKTNPADFEKLKEDALFLKGQVELEAGLYADAVITLSDLINHNSANKEAYFERATAYFELGNFDLSLGDYLTSEVKPAPISPDAIEMVSFSLGLTQGILQGSVQATAEFIPSLLSSLQGMSQGLWAFAQDPVQISTTFIEASQACIQFIKEYTPAETFSELVPELKELVEQWDQLKNEKKGEITGLIIGKYGVDIFAGAGITKAMKLYRDLKKANNLLTFEALTISERNKSLIKLEAAKRVQARKEILQGANLNIQWDKQGKHTQTHQYFESHRNRSILIDSNPQQLANEFAGKGVHFGNRQPGTPGYQEIVNFKKFIGYSVDPTTGEKIATSWGKIHYAKDGVHIVPTEPRY